MPETMLAVRKQRAAPGLDLVRGHPVPDPAPDEVLIGVSFAGICGTDRHIYDWDPWSQGRIRPPVTIGHEFVGSVVAVGSGVRRVRPGARVSGEGHIGCGSCQPCRTGRGHICEHVEMVGLDRDGTFAQYLVLPEDNVWVVDESVPDVVAAVMDPLGNAIHTVMAAGVSGRSVLVTGVGVIGLMAVAVARSAGAGRIIAVDREPRHLERALAMGADVALDANGPDWADEARRVTNGQGPEVWLEMSGAAPAIGAGLRALRNGGTVALLGLPQRPVEVDLAEGIIFKGATVLGISGRRMYESWYQMEGFLAGSSLGIESLVTHVLPVERFDEGFSLLASGEAVKVLLELGEAR